MWRPRRRRKAGSVPETRQALGLGLALGLALLALLLLALPARVLDVDDPHGGAEGAVAAVLLEVAAAATAAAPAAVVPAVAAVAPAATVAAAAATTAAAATAAAAPTAAPAAAAAVGAARVDDRLDVAHRGGREAYPGGEGRVAGLDALRLLAADGRPLHGLAVLALLGLERLEHGLVAAYALDRRDEPRLRAGRAAGGGGRRLLRALRGLRLGGLRLGLRGGLALGGGLRGGLALGGGLRRGLALGGLRRRLALG